MLRVLQYGEIEEMNVCDNLGDHLVGNVYVKFRYEEDAEKAVKDLDNRWYNGKELFCIDVVMVLTQQNVAVLIQQNNFELCLLSCRTLKDTCTDLCHSTSGTLLSEKTDKFVDTVAFNPHDNNATLYVVTVGSWHRRLHSYWPQDSA